MEGHETFGYNIGLRNTIFVDRTFHEGARAVTKRRTGTQFGFDCLDTHRQRMLACGKGLGTLAATGTIRGVSALAHQVSHSRGARGGPRISIQCARLYLAFRRLKHRFIEGDQFNARDCQFARLLRDREALTNLAAVILVTLVESLVDKRSTTAGGRLRLRLLGQCRLRGGHT